MHLNYKNLGALVTLSASVILPVYWITFAVALPMREKYITWVASRNWVWVNSVGFAGGIAGIFAVVIITVYLGPGLLNYSTVALAIAGSVIMTSLLYFEAYILPGLVSAAPALVDQTGSLYTAPPFRIARLVGSIMFSLGFIVWGLVWITSGRLPLWASLCLISGAPLFSLVFLPGNLRLAGVLLYAAGLFGAGLKMLVSP